MINILKILFIIFIVVFSTELVSGQTSKEMNIADKAFGFVDDGEYDSAIVYFEKLMDINKWNFQYVYMLGFSYYSSDKRLKQKAIPLFESIIKYRRTNEFPETYYFLARTYHLLGDFDKATEYYNLFMKYVASGFAGKKLRVEVNEHIRTAFLAQNQMLKNNNQYRVINVGETVNSEYDEYNPIITDDGLSLIFISKKKKTAEQKAKYDYTYYYYYNPNKDVYVAVKELDGDYDNPESIGDQINQNPGILQVKEQEILFYEGEFSDLNMIDSKSDTVFLSLERDDSYGGKDLYMAKKGVNGDLGDFQNLGNIVNSKTDEITPYFDYKTKTLYYSSKGFNGIGGFDVFKTQLRNDRWTAPENIGYPINTPLDDMGYVIANDRKGAYYSSGREEGFGGLDIYYVEFISDSNQVDSLLVIEEKSSKDTVKTVIAVNEDNKEKQNQEEAKPPKEETKTPESPKTETQNIVQINSKEEFINYIKTKSPDFANADTINLVQIGAYKKSIPITYFAGFKEVVGIYYEDNLNRYYAIPARNNKRAASIMLKRARMIGYEDAFSTFFLLY